MRNGSISRFGWLAGAGVLVVVFGFGVGDRLITHVAYALENGRIQASSDELAGVQEVSRTFRMVAKVVRPGVVYISVKGTTVETVDLGPLDERLEQLLKRFAELQMRLRDGEDQDEAEQREMREFFREYLPLQKQREELLRRLHRGPGSGSGIMLDRDGHILTNNHVVGNRGEILVRLSDEREYSATLVGGDPKTDLAVIKIDAHDLHALQFGDSDKAEVGDWVLAVGAPFGLSQSVTHGIISAKGRRNIAGMGAIRYQDFLQTDAAINPGNSGGPLVDLRGEVIGVNTAISTNGDGYNAGVAFTIPSNMAAHIAKQLIAHGEVARGWLGISMAELNERDVEVLDLKNEDGAMVDVLYEGSPAQEAGLQCEDVIVTLNGARVAEMADVRTAIADVLPGQTATLKVIRNGRERTIDVRLGKQPGDIDDWLGKARAIAGREVGTLALRGRAMRDDLRRTFLRMPGHRGLANLAAQQAEKRGVFVVERLGEEQEKSGVEPGDLILSCNGRMVSSVNSLSRALEATRESKSIRLTVRKPDGERRTVRIKRRSDG